MTSNELLSNENQITEDDEKFWGSLLDKVKLNEQSKPAQQIEVLLSVYIYIYIYSIDNNKCDF